MIKNSKIKISVVVCAKNAEKNIAKCLKSIIQNKIDEIILVDGKSSDNTVKNSKKFVDKIIIQKNNGLAAARKIGIKNAKNDYIAMIDSDHLLKKNDIKNLYKDLIKYKFDIVQAQLTSHGKFNFLNKAEQEAWDTVHNIPGPRSMIGTAPCIYKKKIFKFINFNSRITKTMDDTDFIYRINKLKKFKIGIGDTKISQFHEGNIIDFFKKFIWYGHGDAEFVKKYPYKIFSILFHQLFRYLIIFPMKSFIKLKFRAPIFFMLAGIIRFYGLITYFLNIRCFSYH